MKKPHIHGQGPFSAKVRSDRATSRQLSPARLLAPRILERDAAIEDGFFARLMLNLIRHKISNALKLAGKTNLCREEQRLDLGGDFFQ
jgi:hypothetical protein